MTARGVRKNTQCSPCVHGFKEIAKGQERPRSPSWGRAQPRGRWTELPCPSGVRQAFTEVPLLYLTFFFWDWAADHGAKMIKLSGKAFVCLSLERQLPTHNNDLMVKKKKKKRKGLGLNYTLQSRMKTVLLFFKFFFNFVLFQASHSPNTFFFLNISLAGCWLLISLPCGCPKNIRNRCYDALKNFLPRLYEPSPSWVRLEELLF